MVKETPTDGDADTGGCDALVRRRSLTEQLAQRVVELRWAELDPTVRQATQRALLDSLANQVAAAYLTSEWKIVAGTLARWFGAGTASTAGNPQAMAAPAAACCNAMLAHSLRMDDTHAQALLNPGAVVVPAVLAVAEAESICGTDMLAAIVAGYECAIRVGWAISPSHRQRGFHGTATVGTLAAAAAVAKAIGLDQGRVLAALALAATASGGLQAFTRGASEFRAVNAGLAAMHGIIAAYAAADGVEGPADVLESPEGFFRAFADQFHPDAFAVVPESPWKIVEVSQKRHAAARFADAAIDAALTIAGIPGAERDITAIEVVLSPLARRHTDRPGWRNVYEALDSVQCGVALSFVQGRCSFVDYLNHWDHPAVRELAEVVTVRSASDWGQAGLGARVRLTRRHGTAAEAIVPTPKGEPANPLTADEFRHKYFTLMTVAMAGEQAQALWRSVEELERQPDPAKQLLRLTVPAGAPP